MPDFYAHQVFGAMVWDTLDTAVRTKLEPGRDGYRLGLYGPDPLFFYHPLVPNRVSREGHTLHACRPAVILCRFCQDGMAQVPYALSYASGFLCHYALDAACHPQIHAAAGRNPLGSTWIEGALDRLLSPPEDMGLPANLPEDRALFDAAALAFESADGEQIARAWLAFRRASDAIVRFRRLTSPNQRRRSICLDLRQRMEAEAEPAAALIERFTAALESGEDLDFLPTLDFNGNKTEPPDPEIEGSRRPFDALRAEGAETRPK